MRRGFTLVEFLLVVLIIAVLFALACPATRRVRHTATLFTCANNLKEIGLAAHGFRDTHGHFPPGTAPNPNLPPAQRLSWQVSLLPYLERQKDYDRFDPAAGWDAPRNAEAERALPAGVFACPAHPPQPAIRHTNYVGVAGVGADAAARPAGAPGVGFFGYDRQLTREDLTDGTANTLMVLETGFNVGPVVRGGPATVRAIDPGDAPLLDEGRPFGGLHRADKTFGGTRPLGARLLMADGGVRLTPLHVDAAVLAALATVAGGDPVSLDW